MPYFQVYDEYGKQLASMSASDAADAAKEYVDDSRVRLKLHHKRGAVSVFVWEGHGLYYQVVRVRRGVPKARIKALTAKEMGITPNRRKRTSRNSKRRTSRRR